MIFFHGRWLLSGSSLHPSQLSQEDLGELLFSLCYLPAAGRLNVDILRAKQLTPTDLVGGAGKLINSIDLFRLFSLNLSCLYFHPIFLGNLVPFHISPRWDYNHTKNAKSTNLSSQTQAHTYTNYIHTQPQQ